jgi:hemerythrin superfamily protein
MTLLDDIKILLAAPTMNGNDIRTLLRHDHDEAIKIARDMFESEGAEERRTLLRQLKPLLVAHARAEEKEVYGPLLKLRAFADAWGIAQEGGVEHGLIDDLLEKMSKSRKTETDEWKAHAKVLLELLVHHVEEEHTVMFEQLGEHFDDGQREVMGRRFLAARARLLMPKAKAA